MYQVTFPITVQLIDSNNHKRVMVSAGTWTMVRIPNPLYPGKGAWLVIKGTKVGLAEAFFWAMEEEEPRIIVDRTMFRQRPLK